MKLRIKTVCPGCETSTTKDYFPLYIPEFMEAVEFFADLTICPNCGKPWARVSTITLLDPTGDSYDIPLYKGPLT